MRWLERHVLGVLLATGGFFAGLALAVRRYRPIARPGARILLVGDSHMVGLGPYLCKLATAAGRECLDRSKGGTGSPYWRSHLAPLLASARPSLVVFSCGGNDFAQLSDVIHAAVTEIAHEVHSAGAKLVWIEPTPLPYPDRFGALPIWRAAADFVFSTRLVPELAALPRPVDGIHLTQAGYSVWAREIWSWLLS